MLCAFIDWVHGLWATAAVRPSAVPLPSYTTWRWVFYIMFPFCGLGLVCIPWIVSLRPKTSTIGEKLGRVDWLGNLFLTISATLFLVAICWGGAQYRWDSAATLVPLCVGAVGLIWTLVYEYFIASKPFLHLGLFRNIGSVAAYICGVFQGLVVSNPPSGIGRRNEQERLTGTDIRSALLRTFLLPVRQGLHSYTHRTGLVACYGDSGARVYRHGRFGHTNKELHIPYLAGVGIDYSCVGSHYSLGCRYVCRCVGDNSCHPWFRTWLGPQRPKLCHPSDVQAGRRRPRSGHVRLSPAVWYGIGGGDRYGCLSEHHVAKAWTGRPVDRHCHAEQRLRIRDTAIGR